MNKASGICLGIAAFGPLVGWLVHNAVFFSDAAWYNSSSTLGLMVFIAWTGAWVVAAVYWEQAGTNETEEEIQDVYLR